MGKMKLELSPENILGDKITEYEVSDLQELQVILNGKDEWNSLSLVDDKGKSLLMAGGEQNQFGVEIYPPKYFFYRTVQKVDRKELLQFVTRFAQNDISFVQNGKFEKRGSFLGYAYEIILLIIIFGSILWGAYNYINMIFFNKN